MIKRIPVYFLFMLVFSSSPLEADNLTNQLTLRADKDHYLIDDEIRLHMSLSNDIIKKTRCLDATSLGDVRLEIFDQNQKKYGEIGLKSEIIQKNQKVNILPDSEDFEAVLFGVKSTFIKIPSRELVLNLPPGRYSFMLVCSENVVASSSSLVSSNRVDITVDNRGDYVSKQAAYIIAKRLLEENKIDRPLSSIQDNADYWEVEFSPLRSFPDTRTKSTVVSVRKTDGKIIGFKK